jgi:hypothetical protein
MPGDGSPRYLPEYRQHQTAVPVILVAFHPVLRYGY